MRSTALGAENVRQKTPGSTTSYRKYRLGAKPLDTGNCREIIILPTVLPGNSKDTR
ncbi:hypothetical protein ACPOL_0169 [Acidisarcina polymorpha]|uniref:Uncharacterized protein n=1 Tax=Acidisarcina polymorpha TaxID=2211140 RepID=A0A2Z5FSW2_9BACT|nr:hypothetical protein ACPOL_0169 [Acidisarcina polymorpha]